MHLLNAASLAAFDDFLLPLIAHLNTFSTREEAALGPLLPHLFVGDLTSCRRQERSVPFQNLH